MDKKYRKSLSHTITSMTVSIFGFIRYTYTDDIAWGIFTAVFFLLGMWYSYDFVER